MPRPHNVLIPAIINAVNMGYRKIYLWGAENNQFLSLSVDENNHALISQKHFYDHETKRKGIMKRAGIGRRRVHEILHKFMVTFEAYHTLNDYAESRDSRVINQTPNSMIDAFERENRYSD